jgi:hypothetical protein
MLERLDKAVVYYNTDSFVYIDTGQNTMKTGCMLGEWTDELGKGNYIKECFSTGPKSYSYLTNKKKEEKMKGFTLITVKKTMEKEMGKVNLSYKTITRNVKNKTLVNPETSKGFRFEYDKRMIIPEKDGNIEIFPWGFTHKN